MFYFKLFNRINSNKSFLVVPSTIKRNIIEIKSKYELEEKVLYKFKVVSTEELAEMLSFNVDQEIYLNNLENNNTFVSITKELIKFSRYNLLNTNKELSNFIKDNEKFVNINNNLLKNINDYSFFILGPTYLINPFIDFYQLKIEEINPFDGLTVNENLFLKFNNKEDEIFFIMEKIAKLLDDNTNINDIYIANYQESDYIILNKLATFYNIPFIYNSKTPLINIPYINEIMNLKYHEIIELLKNKENLIDTYNKYYLVCKDDFNENINILINVFNKYPHSKYNVETSFKVILDEVKNTYTKKEKYKDGIKIIELDEILTLSKNSNVFIINASYENFPSLSKDSDYLSDKEKEEIGYPTTTEINLLRNKYLKTLIAAPMIKQISFSLKDLEGEYAASDLFSKFASVGLESVKIDFNILNKGYAKDYYKTYFINNKNGILQTTFNPSFKMNETEKALVANYIKDKNIKLSPTDITTYIQAPFVYYLERIMGLNTFKENVSLNLGNFFHIIVEVLLLIFYEEKVDRSKDNNTTKFSYDENVHNNIFNFILSTGNTNIDEFDFHKYFDDFYNIYFNEELIKIKNININNLANSDKLLIRTLFYIRKHKLVIVDALKLLIELEETVKSEELIIEKPIEVENLKGKADLIKLYNNSTYSIIDYKTGERESFSVLKIDELLDKLISGNNEEISFPALNLLQLVLYSYILSKVYSDYKLKDLSYYSYFTNKLNGITTESFENNFYTGGNNRIIESEEVLNDINNKIDILLKKTISSINNVEFSTELRRDEKSKQSLDDSYYSIYEALMFFSEEGGIDDEED